MAPERSTKRQRKHPPADTLSPQQLLTMEQLQDLPAIRRRLQAWIRIEAGLRSLTSVRPSILLAANAINTAFMEATSHLDPCAKPAPSLTPCTVGCLPDTALARRKTAVCIDACALNAWAPELDVLEGELVRPSHPFARVFRDGDLVLGIGEAREKLLDLLEPGKIASAYADATNATLLFRHCHLSHPAVAYLRARRPDFIAANLAANADGNDMAAAQLWRYIKGDRNLLVRFTVRLRDFNQTSGGADEDMTREAFWRVNRMLRKTRVRQALASGGSVHFELGEGFDYHAAASKTVLGSGMQERESHAGGHFTASELRVVCSIVVHKPDLAERVFFWEDTFPVARPADLTKHYEVRNKDAGAM